MHPSEIEQAPLGALLRDVVGDARELVKLEVELATDELRSQARATARAAVAFGVAAAAALVALALFAVALALLLGGGAGVTAAVGGGFVAVAGGAAALGYRALPKSPMGETRARVRSDMNQIKENLA